MKCVITKTSLHAPDVKYTLVQIHKIREHFQFDIYFHMTYCSTYRYTSFTLAKYLHHAGSFSFLLFNIFAPSPAIFIRYMVAICLFVLDLLHLTGPVLSGAIRSAPLGYESVYLPLYKVADTPFHIQGGANLV